MKILRKYLIWISIPIVILIVYLLSPLLLRLTGENLVYQDPMEPADIILVLSGGAPGRVMEAVDIYRKGLSKKIILTSQEYPEGYKTLKERGLNIPIEEDIEMMVLNYFKIPSRDVEIIPQTCNSTFSEATIAIPYLLQKGIKKSIIVTSKFHSKRAMKIFTNLSEGKIRFIMIPSKYDMFDPKIWWKERTFARYVFIEYQKLSEFYISLIIRKIIGPGTSSSGSLPPRP